jgi:hypothetical protein
LIGSPSSPASPAASASGPGRARSGTACEREGLVGRIAPFEGEPFAIRALDEIGIDIRANRSKSVDEIDPADEEGGACYLALADDPRPGRSELRWLLTASQLRRLAE